MSYEVLVRGFGDYTVNRKGDVFSLKRGVRRKLKPTKTHYGYHKVTLTSEGVCHQKLVHRLVLDAFKGPPKPHQECRHLNNIRTDNRLENLAWGTRSENEADKVRFGTSNMGEKHGMAKLTEVDVRDIKGLLHQDAMTQTAIAKQYHVDPATISNIQRGINWKHVGVNYDAI
jgi:hypothetical protein